MQTKLNSIINPIDNVIQFVSYCQYGVRQWKNCASCMELDSIDKEMEYNVHPNFSKTLTKKYPLFRQGLYSFVLVEV